MSAAPIVHAVFHESAGGCLKQVRSPRLDRIIVLRDDLSIGPIDRTDGESRTRGLREQFGDDVTAPIALIDTFWSEVASPDNRIVVWVNRRDARDHAGFLELLRRRGDAPLDVVDITDIEFASDDGADPPAALRLGELAPARVIERNLLGLAAPLSATAAASYAQHWARLRHENAPLRIVENGTLVSAPISHFDTSLVSAVTTEWQPTGEVLGLFHWTAREDGIFPPDVSFVLSRLAALVGAGQLEGAGDLARLEDCSRTRVRRPQNG